MTSPGNERFLARWSRLKRAQDGDAGATTSLPAQPVVGVAATGAVPAARAENENAASAPAAGVSAESALPSVESLTMDSDYAQFFQPKVPEGLRREAVKKLFADPHFNIMDGLDTYIDDYSKPDPLPPGMLEQLVHARDIIDHPSNRKPEEGEQAPAVATSEENGQADETAALEQSYDVAAGQPEGQVANEDQRTAALEGAPRPELKTGIAKPDGNA